MFSNASSKRLPVSCEPCRKRKIRCPRNQPPCGTCRRRGLSPSECYYQRRPAYSATRRSDQADSPDATQEELVERVRSLEDLLRRHMGVRPSDSPPEEPQTHTTSPAATNSHGDRREGTESSFAEVNYPEQVAGVSRPVGVLRVLPSGHVRYEPQASQWSSVLGNTPGEEALREIHHPQTEDGTSFPFAQDAVLARKELLATLPPVRQCDELKDVYIQVFSPLFHILHDPTLEAEYAAFRRDPESATLSWLALLFVILAVAVTALEDSNPLLCDLGRENNASSNIKTISSRYRAAAMRCLAADQILWRHNIKSLQALVLLIYALSHVHGQTWALLGMTYNIALALGCHIDPEKFKLGLLECEERRRCWAGVMMLYTIQNTSQGHLDQQSKLTQNVRLPADVDDQDLLSGMSPSARSGPTQMSYLLFKFRLYNLSSRICEQIFGSTISSRSAIRALDADVSREQDLLCNRYLSDSQESGSLPIHHVVHFNILYGYSHQLLLLLHRPFFHRYLINDNVQDVEESRDRCMEAAQGLLEIHKSLAESPEYAAYRWYNNGLGSFHAFHAAVVLAMVLMSSVSEARFDGIRNMLLESLRIFETLAERSTVCEKSTPILRQLIDMALTRSPNSRSTSTAQNLEPQISTLEKGPSQATSIGGCNSNLDSHMDALVGQLRPERWLNPSAMSWGDWNFLLAETSPDLAVQ